MTTKNCPLHPNRPAAVWFDNETYMCEECATHMPTFSDAAVFPAPPAKKSAGFRDLSAADRQRIGMLTHFALDKLWYVGPDSAPDGYEPKPGETRDYQGCCPICCAPCASLKELLDDGQLDQWVLGWPDLLHGCGWWDDNRQRVDRDWLARNWANADDMGCHDA